MTRCSTRAICTTGGCTPRCSCPWSRTRCAAPGWSLGTWMDLPAWSARGPLRACASAWPRSWGLPGTSPARPWTRSRRSPRRARTSRDSSARSWTRARGRSTPRSSRAALAGPTTRPSSSRRSWTTCAGGASPACSSGTAQRQTLRALRRSPLRASRRSHCGACAPRLRRALRPRGRRPTFPPTLRPLYLRAPQAERARNARLGLAGEEESHGG